MYKLTLAAFLAVVGFGAPITAADPPSIGKPPRGYTHDRFAPKPDIKRVFRAFVVSFDSKDDDTGDANGDLLRVPHWVAQEMRRWEPPEDEKDTDAAWCLDTLKDRPTWFTDKQLFSAGVAPNDASYRNSGFERGHMAMKLLAERLGQNAAYNTHTVLNAIPQLGKFNKGIWQKVEYLTGAWAQTYGKIWVIQGPVFMKAPLRWIGDEGERRVAVPDAAFKIVVREKTKDERGVAKPKEKQDPEVLAFIYPQLGPGYYGPTKEYRHERFLTSVDEIEQLTGLDFPLGGDNRAMEKRVESTPAPKLWTPKIVDLKNKRLFLSGCRGSR